VPARWSKGLTMSVRSLGQRRRGSKRGRSGCPRQLSDGEQGGGPGWHRGGEAGGGGRRGGGALRRCAPLISARGGGRWPRGGGNGGRGNGGNGEAMGAGKAAATAVQSMVHTVGRLCPDSEADKRA
jgi:hypothetical protein